MFLFFYFILLFVSLLLVHTVSFSFVLTYLWRKKKRLNLFVVVFKFSFQSTVNRFEKFIIRNYIFTLWGLKLCHIKFFICTTFHHNSLYQLMFVFLHLLSLETYLLFFIIFITDVLIINIVISHLIFQMVGQKNSTWFWFTDSFIIFFMIINNENKLKIN